MKHKFLARGAVGPISRFSWPTPSLDAGRPGAWVEVEGSLVPCAHGIHVCRPGDLAHWICDELWEVEVAGEAVDGLDCLIVARARLVRRVDAWSERGGGSFADACVEHAAEQTRGGPGEAVRELVDDARWMAKNGYVALGAFTAAVAVSRLSPGEVEDAFRRERAWQSAWIADGLLLST